MRVYEEWTRENKRHNDENFAVVTRETVIAQKLHAMVDLGIANSRMNDFFDVWFLCREFEFQRVALANAIRATFERRLTPIPDEAPLALAEAFALDAGKQSQGSAFLDGPTAVEAAQRLRPQIVIRDIGLPGMSGYEAYRDVRSLQAALDGTFPTRFCFPGLPRLEGFIGNRHGSRRGRHHRRCVRRKLRERFQQAGSYRQSVHYLGWAHRGYCELQRRLHFATEMICAERIA